MKIKKNVFIQDLIEIRLHLVICFYSFVVQFLFCFISIKTIHTNTVTETYNEKKKEIQAEETYAYKGFFSTRVA
jgi:Sec-independent protein secretion pathway component TatC